MTPDETRTHHDLWPMTRGLWVRVRSKVPAGYLCHCLHVSQVVCLFLSYLCLVTNKHPKLRLSLFKFFSDFPDKGGQRSLNFFKPL